MLEILLIIILLPFAIMTPIIFFGELINSGTSSSSYTPASKHKPIKITGAFWWGLSATGCAFILVGALWERFL
jgi:hypothetical protein